MMTKAYRLIIRMAVFRETAIWLRISTSLISLNLGRWLQMRNMVQSIKWVAICTAIWIILFESFEMKIIVSGVLVSVFSLLFTEKFLIGGHFYDYYPIKIIWLIKYLLFLIFEIYLAGFETMRLIFTGRVNPGIVDIKTTLDDGFKTSILANSITLTPGTVTIDCSGEDLKVLWIDVKTTDSVAAGKIIKEKLEKRLR